MLDAEPRARGWAGGRGNHDELTGRRLTNRVLGVGRADRGEHDVLTAAVSACVRVPLFTEHLFQLKARRGMPHVRRGAA